MTGKGDSLTGTEISIGISLGVAIGIVLSGGCFLLKRRIDACADWIGLKLSPWFKQERMCKNSDSSSRSEFIVYAELSLSILPELAHGNSSGTPIRSVSNTVSQDLMQTQGDFSADPVYTRGGLSADFIRAHEDLPASLIQIHGAFSGEEPTEYASVKRDEQCVANFI
ncbi:uncharacterized protein LOC144695359 [Cetorhinus maximus]